MKLHVHRIVRTNLTLKIISLILGFGVWQLLTNLRTHTITLEVPVCFYNQPEHTNIQAPEKMRVSLVGSRGDLALVTLPELAAHFDANLLHDGTNYLLISDATLFLPPTIKLLNYAPAPLKVSYTQQAAQVDAIQ